MICTERISVARIFRVFMLGWILMSASASAQLFQAADGGPGFESGRGGASPMPGGYYSVGHSQPVGGLADVYMVHTNLVGGVIGGWTYNFGGQDFGHDIQRCGNGDFVITGVTNVAGSNDMFIMRVGPGGALVWARRIGTPNDDVGVDVIQAANGDIIAAGWGNGAAGNREGLMVRLTGAGVLVFSTLYTPAAAPNLDDYFHGLWQAGNGDLLLCGGTNSFGANAYQGWVVRTNPAGVPIWSNHLGGANSNEEFNSITQLVVGGQAGNIVAAGSTTGVPGDPLDFYVVKLTAAGAFIAPDITGGTLVNSEAMFQVRENLAVNVGNIILAGRMAPGPLGMEDGYVVEMIPVWACPVGKAWSMVYGGAGNDRLYAAQEAPNNCFPGFIMCGRTSSAGLVPAGDPQQHYLIKTNNAGVSGCNEMPPQDRCTQPNFPIAGAPLAWPAAPAPLVANPPVVNMNLGAVLCFTPCPPPPPKTNFTDMGSLVQTLDAAFPNPVAAGSTFQLPYLLSESNEASIVVSDITGRTVYNGTQPASAGSGNLSISTEGWPSGIYVIRVDIGGDARMQRIVVMDK